MWQRFCYNSGEIEFNYENDFNFTIGGANVLLAPQSGFILEVTKDGVSLSASAKALAESIADKTGISVKSVAYKLNHIL